MLQCTHQPYQRVMIEGTWYTISGLYYYCIFSLILVPVVMVVCFSLCGILCLICLETLMHWSIKLRRRSETVMVPSNRVHVRTISRILQLSKQKRKQTHTLLPRNPKSPTPICFLFCVVLLFSSSVPVCPAYLFGFRMLIAMDGQAWRAWLLPSCREVAVRARDCCMSWVFHTLEPRRKKGSRETCFVWEMVSLFLVGLHEHFDIFWYIWGPERYSRADQNTFHLQEQIPTMASPRIPADPNPGYM